jgi:hypothetical protein
MGALRPRKDGQSLGELFTFDQREFTLPASLASYSLAETGYAYVPASCAALEPCRAHVALHGGKQNYDAIGATFSMQGITNGPIPVI